MNPQVLKMSQFAARLEAAADIIKIKFAIGSEQIQQTMQFKLFTKHLFFSQ
jgi:hypothetical protein